MALTRLDYGGATGLYSNSVAVGETTAIAMSSVATAPPAGDELFILLRTYVAYSNSIPNNITVATPHGWTLVRASGDNFNGASLNTRNRVILLYRRADGTSDDRPDIKVVSNVPLTATRLAAIGATLIGYRGGRLTYLSDGTLPDTDASGTTDPATTAVPDDTLIVVHAANRFRPSGSPFWPTLSTANSFTAFYEHDPGATTYASVMNAAAADREVALAATINLPQWTLTQGNSPGEAHAVWGAFTIVPLAGGIHQGGVIGSPGIFVS